MFSLEYYINITNLFVNNSIQTVLQNLFNKQYILFK